MLHRKIRILVVDDSAFMRKAIANMLESAEDIEVIDSARDGLEAVEKVEKLRPDVITLDIEMPRMDGISALKKIMEVRPTPVIMVSSLTEEGAQVTMQALELGAVDFIPKPLSFVSLDIIKIKEELVAKVRSIGSQPLLRRLLLRARVTKSTSSTTASASARPARSANGAKRTRLSANAIARTKSGPSGKYNVLAIGTSTGGPPALQAVIPLLPKDFPVGILIVQHMPPMFTKSLANRLDSLSQLTVVEAEGGEKIEGGMVFVAPGEKHLTVKKSGREYRTLISDEPANLLHRPSVDVMTASVARNYQHKALGVIMTGMGKDGLKGMTLMKAQGATLFAQDEESSVVYGMPKAVVDAGIADRVCPLKEMAASIVKEIDS